MAATRGNAALAMNSFALALMAEWLPGRLLMKLTIQKH